MHSKETEFTNLVETNQGIVHKICRIYCDSREEHEDLFQEIVLQLWKSYDSFKGDSKFTTWMYRVSLNTAITLIRKKKRTVLTSSIDAREYFDIRASQPDPEQEARLESLYAAIKKLNEIERAVIIQYLEDLPYREIAENLGISEVNARVKMNRIKTKLKKLMQPERNA